MTTGVSETEIPADQIALNGCFDRLSDKDLTLVIRDFLLGSIRDLAAALKLSRADLRDRVRNCLTEAERREFDRALSRPIIRQRVPSRFMLLLIAHHLAETPPLD